MFVAPINYFIELFFRKSSFYFIIFYFCYFLNLFGYVTHILRKSTVHKTASLADEGHSAYCQSSGAHNIKHNLWKLALRDHLNLMPNRGIELGTFCSRERCINRSATAPRSFYDSYNHFMIV